MKPVIGISCGTFYDKAWCPPSFGHRQTYVDAVTTAGGVPLLIPPLRDEELLRAIYDRLDGLLLAGGGDISPTRYGEQPHAQLGPIDALRDEAEIPFARWALLEGKPVLGICRGAQVINVALGGTLYQDIPSQVPTTLKHDDSYLQEDWTFMAHEMRVDPASRLAAALGSASLQTNSLHHQSIKDVAPGLCAVAWAPDGVVEAIEGLNGHFAIGVQCHPEALQGQADPRWRGLFRAFVLSCIQFHQQLLLAA